MKDKTDTEIKIKEKGSGIGPAVNQDGGVHSRTAPGGFKPLRHPRVWTAREFNRKKGRPYAFVVGKGNKWDCPFRCPQDGSKEEVLEKYRQHLVKAKLLRHLPELRGRNLVCFCARSAHAHCHGTLLLQLANRK